MDNSNKKRFLLDFTYGGKYCPKINLKNKIVVSPGKQLFFSRKQTMNLNFVLLLSFFFTSLDKIFKENYIWNKKKSFFPPFVFF